MRFIRRHHVVLAIVVASAGCETSEYVSRVLSPESQTTLRERSPHGDLEVTVPDDRGRLRRGRIVRVEPDVIVVELPNGEASVPNRTIDEVRRRNHPLGALEGLGLGVLGGAAGGAAVFGLACPSGENGCFEVDRGGAAFIGAAIGAVFGGLTGLVIGGVRGHTTHYLFY